MALTQVDQGLLNSYAQYTGFKNRIINGAMVVDQRNAGASVTNTTSTVYTLDRWSCYGTQASKFTVQQNAGSVTPPVGFTNYLGDTSLSAYSVGASDVFMISQPIEGFNCSDFGWGTASAQPVTLSFKVRSSLTGSFGGVIRISSTATYPFLYTITSANTWTDVSITISGYTGTMFNSTTNSTGIFVRFSLGAGSNGSATANSWTTVSPDPVQATGATSVVGTNGATFYITGVQLEKGSTATSFDYRPYGTELALCQRYCQVFRSTGGEYDYFASGAFYNSTQGRVFKPLLVTMRAAPTFSSTAFGSFYIDAVSYVSLSSLSLEAAEPQSVRLGFTASSAGSNATGYGCFLASSTSSTEVLSFFAEL